MSTSQVIDKGRIVIAVDQYPERVNGQVVFIQGTQTPKMKNKWMAIGEATKWQHADSSVSITERVYLQPVSCQGAFYEQKTFWDSEQQQHAPQQHAPQPQYQAPQQQAPQQSGYRR